MYENIVILWVLIIAFMLPQLTECIFDGLYMTAIGSQP
jgi:hypothetical protein